MAAILFVCLGNICRSPAAEGILLHLIKKLPGPADLAVESCGLGDWHEGELPDERMRRAAKDRGIALTSRAQPFRNDFFDKFDYILAADQKVMNELRRWARTPEHKAKIHLITKYSAAYQDQDIPDPYYLDQGHFELVMDMLEDACKGLLAKITHKSIPE